MPERPQIAGFEAEALDPFFLGLLHVFCHSQETLTNIGQMWDIGLGNKCPGQVQKLALGQAKPTLISSGKVFILC